MCITVRKSHRTLTVTSHQEDNLSKATSSLFPIKMIAKLERHTVLNSKTMTNQRIPTNNGKNNKTMIRINTNRTTFLECFMSF